MIDELKRFGIYIHIPFCRQKCFYCDFASLKVNAINQNLYQQYVQALCQEIVLYRELFPDIYIDTIYFGGGTPSILPAELIEQILTQIKKSFAINPRAEITLEANPGTVDENKLAKLHRAGINRLSFGVQAVQDELLKKIGRIHTIEQAEFAVHEAKKVGFNNISVDLIYGLPTQTMDMLKQSVAWALAQKVQHISIYGLQIEEGTVFGKLYDEGKLILPSEEETEAMYDYLTNTLPKHNYRRYEISNFALPNFESKHNLSYWQDKFYLGLGAGAHGYYFNKRVENPFDLQAYITKCNHHEFPYEQEENVDEKAHIEEFCFLALRTATGIDETQFECKFKQSIDNLYGEKIAKLLAQKLIVRQDKHIHLTDKGMKLGNLVFEEFLL